VVNKLTILLLHGYGIDTHPSKLLHLGITRIHARDAFHQCTKITVGSTNGTVRKLANGSIAAFVLPQFVSDDSQLFTVRNEYNGMILLSSFADKRPQHNL